MCASALLTVSGAVLAVPPAASAAGPSGWADWGPLTGGSNNYASTMQLPGLGFPRAVLASDSRAPAQLPSGVSTFLGGSSDPVPTPVGAKYGSSRGHPYLNLRPRADTATTPSTTTYAFDEPTPSTGWTFVLGDVDADQVQVSAKDASGEPVSAATINGWYRGSFNYAGDPDRPTWDAATSTLVGNAGAVDTNGASAWFEPDVSLASLTLLFTRRSGFPIYQTWFASLSRTISGTVTDVSTAGGHCSLTDVAVHLVGPHGEQLATVHPDASGGYSFGSVATQAGYQVSVDPPGTCAVVGPESATVSTASADATADFQVRQVIPQPVSGTVTTTGGQPVAGATITLTRPGGATVTTTTDAAGQYLIDDNPVGTGYTVAITAWPSGYHVSGATSRTFDVSTAPITGQDFTLAELPSVSGTVTGGGDQLDGVTVTLTPTGGGTPQTTTTRGDGSYEFTHVPAGGYTISVTPPPGYRATSDRTVTVGATDIGGQDFALDRPGALGGTVTDDGGAAVPDTQVHVGGPGGQRTLSTDADGNYFLDDLSAGTYQITLDPPAGYRITSTSTRSTTITAAGEIRGGLDFVVARLAPPPPSTSVGPTTGSVAATGSPTGPLLLTGLLLLGVGAVLTAIGRTAALRPSWLAARSGTNQPGRRVGR